MKTSLIIIALLGILSIIGVVFWVLQADNSPDTAQDTVHRVGHSSLDHVYNTVKSNTIRNFGFDVVLFYEDERVSMLYYEQTDTFLINIDTFTTVQADRQYAEQIFLSILQITEAGACTLQVDIVVPHYADFQNDGTYGLSFCPGATSLENI